MSKHNIDGLSVNVYGNIGNLPIIFIHAFPLSSRMWEPQVIEFEKDYRVITYDLRGFGESEKGDGIYTIESHADDLFTIINGLELDNPVVCGLSMGGYIALRALERSQDKFRGVILCDTRSFADDNPGKIKRAEQIKRIKKGDRKTFDEEFIKNTLSPKTMEGKKDVVDSIRKMISEQIDSSVAGALLTMAARTDTTEYLENIKIPALVIVGEDDKLTPASPSRLMNAKIRTSTLSIIPGAGHFSNVENPDEFNKAILKFLIGIKS